MATDFRLPDLGEGVHEGEIVRVLVAEGDRVREDQPLLEVETDKASVEIPSPFSGVVTKVHVAPKQVVNVGDVMVTFDTASATPASVAAKSAPARGHAPPAPPAPPAPAAPAAGRPGAGPSQRAPASPAVR
jgi:pyruvate dehydrogenase E2 component (dihydrolipoamide acetyltransferase)